VCVCVCVCVHVYTHTHTHTHTHTQSRAMRRARFIYVRAAALLAADKYSHALLAADIHTTHTLTHTHSHALCDVPVIERLTQVKRDLAELNFSLPSSAFIPLCSVTDRYMSAASKAYQHLVLLLLCP
jgi:hypothetical protein